MKYDPEKHNRRSVRLKGYDYSQEGAYFITICTYDKALIFGDIVDGEVVLNRRSIIAKNCWGEIPQHFKNVQLDEFVVMPNHVHGIILIVGATHASPLRTQTEQTDSQQPNGPKPKSIGAIVGSYKSAVSKRIHEINNTPGTTTWQRNYFEHVIRNEKSLYQIRQYIINNPLQWEFDNENPKNLKVINT